MRFTSVITNPGESKGARSSKNFVAASAGGNNLNSYANYDEGRSVRKRDKPNELRKGGYNPPWLEEDEDVKVVRLGKPVSRFKTSNSVEIFEGKTLKIKFLEGLHKYTIVKSGEHPAVIAAYVLRDTPEYLSWYNNKGILSVDHYKLKENCLRIFKDANVGEHVDFYMNCLETYGPREMLYTKKTDQVRNNDWFQFCAIHTTFINVGVGALGAIDQWKPKKRKNKSQCQMFTSFKNAGKIQDILEDPSTTELLQKVRDAQEGGNIAKISEMFDSMIKLSSNSTVGSIVSKIQELDTGGGLQRILGLFDAVLEKVVGVKQWSTDNPVLSKIVLGLALAICLALVVAAVGTITTAVISVVKAIVAYKTGVVPALSMPAQCQAWSMAQSVVAILSMAGMATGCNMTLPNCIQLGRFTSDLVGSVESVLPTWLDAVCKHFGIEVPFTLTRAGETPKFLTDLLEFFKEDNLTVRVLQEDKMANRCIQLFRDSIKFRPLFFDRGGEFSSPYFQGLYKRLEELFNSVIANGSLVHDRICPLFAWLKGEAGVGKSTLIQLMLEAFSAVASKDEVITNYDPRFKEPYSPKNMYPRIPGSEYWSGYRGQAFAVWNEVFSSADIMSRKVTSTELLVAIENTSCPVNMADLGSKGTTFFTSSVVVATSNEIDFEGLGLTCPGALARRIHFPLQVERMATLESDYSNIDQCWKFTLFKIKNHEKEQQLGISSHLPDKESFVFSDIVKAMVSEFKSRVVSRDNKNLSTPDWSKLVGQAQMFRSLGMYFEHDEDLSAQRFALDPVYHEHKHKDETYRAKLKSIDLPWNAGDKGFEVTRKGRKYKVPCEIPARVGIKGASDLFLRALRTWVRDKFPRTFVYEVFRTHTPEDPLDEFQEMVLGRLYAGIVKCPHEHEFYKTDVRRMMMDDMESFFEEEDFEHAKYTYGQKLEVKIANFVFHATDYEMYVVDYTGKRSSLFDKYTESMSSVLMVNRVCNRMSKRFVKATGWTFFSPQFFKGLGAGLIGALGINLLVGTASLIMMAVCKWSKEEVHTPGFLGEKLNANMVAQSLMKDKEMAQLPRKGVRLRYAKFQGGEEGVQRWINLMSNSRMVTCRYAEGFTTMSNILFGTASQAMLPLHMWECGTLRSIEIFSHDGTDSKSYNRQDFSVKTFSGYDKVLLLFKACVTMGELRDIRRQFPEKLVGEYSNTMRLMKAMDDDNKVCHYFKTFDNLVRNTSPLECESNLQDRYQLIIRDYFLGVNGEGAQGLCAYPIITLDPRYQSTPILGFHTAQVGNDSVITPISSMDWDYGAEFQFSVVFPYEEHFHMDKGFSFGPKGTCSGPKPIKAVGTASNTSFVKTPLYDHLPPPDFAPAVLKNVKPTPYSVFDIKFGKYQKEEYDPRITDILEHQTSEMFDGLLPRAPKPNDIDTMMSFDEVIHGCPRYMIKSVDTSSSAGFPHNTDQDTKSTRDFIDHEQDYVNPRVKELYNAKLSRIDQGVLEMSVVQDNLKDELVSLEKVRIHKTRVFCGSELIERLVMKGICGKLVGWLKQHRALGPIQVGANAHNFDWRLIYDVIVRHGKERRIGGDIAGMDVSTPHFVQRVMFLFFCYALGLYPEHPMYNRYKWVSVAICSVIHIRGNRSYIFSRGNSSGNWITTLVNSVMIWFYFSTIFLIARPAEEEHKKFKNCVSLVIYGDDTGGGVSKDVEWYDNLVIAHYMMSLFGVDFTDPGKGQIETRFLQTPPSFLCRTFHVVGSGAYVKAPLDWSSLSRLLYYYRHNPEVHTAQEAVYLNLDCFERELVHYDDDARRQIIDMVTKALSQCKFSYTFGDGKMWERRFTAAYVSCFDLLDC